MKRAHIVVLSVLFFCFLVGILYLARSKAIESFDESQDTVYYVRVKPKTNDHPWFGKGSASTYNLNNMQQNSKVVLSKNNTYIFDLSHLSNVGYSFYLSTAPEGNGTNRILSTYYNAFSRGVPGQPGAYYHVHIPDDATAADLYIACETELFMGLPLSIK